MIVVNRRRARATRTTSVWIVSIPLCLTAACGGDGSSEVGRDRTGVVVSNGSAIHRFTEVDCAESVVTGTASDDGSGHDRAVVRVEIAFVDEGGTVALFEDGAAEPAIVGRFDGIDVERDSGARTSTVSFDGGTGELSFNCP